MDRISQQDERKYTCSIKNYIISEEKGCSEYSICREERQYALYLNNILKKFGHHAVREERRDSVKRKEDYVDKIFWICGIPEDADVVEVFYEVAFMRDFLERNRRIYLRDQDHADIEDTISRRTFKPKDYHIDNMHQENENLSFNLKLLKYCYEGSGDQNGREAYETTIESMTDLVEEVNYGHNQSKLDELKLKLRNLNCDALDKEKLVAMMNAKPDIAVLYREGDDPKQYLIFLECKFDSGEDIYYKKAGEKITQTNVQYWIADFLYRNGYLGVNIELDPGMISEKRARKIEFSRNEVDGNAIMISALIMLNKEIFA